MKFFHFQFMQNVDKLILIVEDDASHSALIQRSLEKAGYRNLYFAKTLEAYKELLLEINPDIVLMDMRLPDGESLHMEMKPLEQQHFPILMMTSFGDEVKAVESIRAGFIDYVVKSPETFSNMPQKVERAFRQWKHVLEKKAAEEALRESEERWKRISQATFEGIGISFEGRIVDLNEQLANMLGYDPEEVIGKRILDFVDASDKALVAEKVQQEATGSYENYLVRKDGTVFPVEVRFSEIQYKGKKARVTAVRDITIHKKIEEELKKAKEKAEQSDNLKTTFLQNLSHEIRTPMNGIMGFSEFLKNPSLTFDQQQSYIEIINNCSKQLLSIINDIIEISKIENGMVTINENIFNINALLEDLYYYFKPQAQEKNLKLEYFSPYANTEAKVIGDQSCINQVLSSLISNAIKFTNHGYVRFGFEQKHNGLLFFVKDTGVGIPKAFHSTIFERFKQIDTSSTRTSGGLGLGLAIAKTYVTEMGGEIWLESETGQGSTFFFQLPVKSKSKEPVPSERLSPLAIPNMKGKCIVIAEDDMANFILLQAYLASSEAKILHASNGREALQYCDENDSVDLVFMDLKMPVMDGFEATRLIKQKFPHIPVIAQTAYAYAEDKQKALSCGCDDIITKPIKKSELITLLKDKYSVLSR